MVPADDGNIRTAVLDCPVHVPCVRFKSVLYGVNQIPGGRRTNGEQQEIAGLHAHRTALFHRQLPPKRR